MLWPGTWECIPDTVRRGDVAHAGAGVALWCRRTFRNAKWPPFWVPFGPAGLHQYQLRLVWRTVPFAAAAPVVVNRHEARAYCAWRSRAAAAADPAAPPFRLLAEAEHHALRSASLPDPFAPGTVPVASAAVAATPAADPLAAAAGAALRDVANVQLAYGAEAPVDAFPAAERAGGAAHGNVWSWCEDWFSALPGGHGVHPYYDDFSSPCYDGEHAVIMGGSFMSTGDEASRFARFHFRCTPPLGLLPVAPDLVMSLRHAWPRPRGWRSSGSQCKAPKGACRPHFHQHAGFYIVRSATQPPLTHVDSPPPHVGSWNPSSSSSAAACRATATPTVTAAALAHYGTAHGTLAATAPALAAALPPFPAAIAGAVESALAAAGAKTGSALEVGSGVGAVSFKLAEVFGRVTAIERDNHMVLLSQRLQSDASAVLGCGLPAPPSPPPRNRAAPETLPHLSPPQPHRGRHLHKSTPPLSPCLARHATRTLLTCTLLPPQHAAWLDHGADAHASCRGARVQGSVATDVRVERPVNADVGARVAFRLMDPCCIAPDIGQYDAVVINEVLDRTVSPKAALSRVGGVNPIVKRGGASRSACLEDCLALLMHECQHTGAPGPAMAVTTLRRSPSCGSLASASAHAWHPFHSAHGHSIGRGHRLRRAPLGRGDRGVRNA